MDNKPVKSFSEFTRILKESRINEGILSTIKNIVKKVKDFFEGTGSRWLNAIIFAAQNKLPKGVTLYPTTLDMEILQDNGVHYEKPDFFALRESEKINVEQFNTINEVEGQVELEHPNKQIENVDSVELLRRLKDAITGGEKRKPLLIWGAPGIGKTAIVNAIGKEYFGPKAVDEQRIIECTLSTMLPEDFFIPSVEDGKAIDTPKDWLPVYRIGKKYKNAEGEEITGDQMANGPDGKGGILFLDELTRARSAVQDVCLKLVLERKVGNFHLGSKWVVVAAANRQGDDDSGTYNFSTALGNRFDQVNYALRPADWTKWAMEAKDEDGQFLVDQDVLGFISFNEDWFYTLNPTESAEIFASPRQWTAASVNLLIRKQNCEAEGRKMSDDEAESIVAGSVGKGAASAFMGFMKLSRKIKIEEMKLVYTNPEKAPLPPKDKNSNEYKMDETYAMISAIVYNKRKEALTHPEMMNFIKYICRLKDSKWAAKAMDFIKTVKPTLKEDEYWTQDCLNTLIDAYPDFNRQSK